MKHKKSKRTEKLGINHIDREEEWQHRTAFHIGNINDLRQERRRGKNQFMSRQTQRKD
jgi:hypothetical protein